MFEDSFSYYFTWLLSVIIIYIIILLFTKKYESESYTNQYNYSKQFIRFRFWYIIVYLCAVGADWLQGPYVYHLYEYYGYNISQIAFLFIIGFATSMIFGTVIASAADTWGRKRICIIYGILYTLSCFTKHSPVFYILLIGRFLGGISTSILFTGFEAWMISEHHSKKFPDEWIAITFSIQTFWNGIVAVVAGVMSSVAVDNFGPVAPFDMSFILLLIGTFIVWRTWGENYGDSEESLRVTLITAVTSMKSDLKITYLGITQSCFEGAMYIFVFMWTPALENTSPFRKQILHGWIFASFMVAIMIGSTIFRFCLNLKIPVEKITLILLNVSAISLAVPAWIENHFIRMMCFLLFEFCVGIYWPAIGTLRSRYLPENVRATVMNFFRIPLNLIVVIVLAKIENLKERPVFLLCCTFLVLSTFSLLRLINYIEKDDDNQTRSIRLESQDSIDPDSELTPLQSISI